MHPLDYWLTRKAKAPKQEQAGTTASCLAGDVGLAEALQLDGAWCHEARERAITLYGEGRWEACIAIIRGLVLLGSESPVDTILLERCQARLERGA